MTFASFRSTLGCAVMAAALVLLPSCMKLEQAIVVTPDGSGTATIKMVMDMAKLEEIKAMFPGMGEGEGDDPEEKLDAEKLKERLKGKEGVELVSATPIDDQEKKLKGFEAKVKFVSLDAFFRAGLDMGHSAKLEDAGEGRWRLTRDRINPAGDGAEMDEEAMGAQIEMFKGMLEGVMGELSMTFSLAVPGTIVETSGTKDEAGKTVTWKDGFNDLMVAKSKPQVVVFKPEGSLKLKPFHVVADQDGNAKDGGAVTTPSAEKPAEAPAPAPAPVEPK